MVALAISLRGHGQCGAERREAPVLGMDGEVGGTQV